MDPHKNWEENHERFLENLEDMGRRIGQLYSDIFDESLLTIEDDSDEGVLLLYGYCKYTSEKLFFSVMASRDLENPEEDSTYVNIGFHDTPQPFYFDTRDMKEQEYVPPIRWIDWCADQIQKAKGKIDYFIRDSHPFIASQHATANPLHSPFLHKKLVRLGFLIWLLLHSLESHDIRVLFSINLYLSQIRYGRDSQATPSLSPSSL